MNESVSKPFVHLHVHSEYSLLDGAASIDRLVQAAADQGMKALALTDHGVMYGAIAFYKACLAHNIKPIIGCEVYFTAGSRFETGNRKDNPIYHLILLAQNEVGYRNLMQLVSIGQLEGMHYKPRVDIESLTKYNEGIICLSACLGGEINQHLLHSNVTEARLAAERYLSIFGDRFYLELQDHGLLEQKRVNVQLIELAELLNIELVATNDVHYLNQADAHIQDVLICIGTGKTLKDDQRLKMPTDQLYLKSGEEMASLFAHVPQAIVNTNVIAERCDLQLSLGRADLPSFWPIPENSSSADYLKQLCVEGLTERYSTLTAFKEDEAYRLELKSRLEYELSIIERMGFSDYFLIVWDFIRFAREKGIRVGPGRGSAGGSLVAYTLFITDVDPIKYKLFFERFLNPERVSMPDIDIDFDDERRDEVIHYVVAKYGEEHVAQIITFGTLAAKAAIRDVGRVLSSPFQEVDKVAKLIPNQVGITLAKAFLATPALQQLVEQSASIKELYSTASAVEGKPRHTSTHAAGVVISAQPLTNYTPLQAGSEHIPLTQYSMEHLESLGLLKMDFLGLRTLSILERAHKWVKLIYGFDVDFSKIGDDDAKTYQMLSHGETTGVFQLESTGVRKVLKDLKPNTFEDIVSVLALYRPGPMEFIPKYIEGKHNKIHVEYPDDSLRHILQDTYGIIVYQEQIMQIASTMAGFTLGQADLLRRAVSKKKREVLDEQRAHFVSGSEKLGHSREVANSVYDMIVRFADYGFNRAHAVAYGVLAFQTAWFKAHYPEIFLASMLASVAGNMNKTAEYVAECIKMNIAVLPPCINESSYYFTPTENGIRFGLSAIKNVGTQAIESILKARKDGPFNSFIDFCKRIDLRVVNKRVLESLILAGALDNMDGHRAQHYAVIEDMLEAVGKWKKQKEELQIELFGFDEVQNWSVELPQIRPFTMSEQLEHEYELLGLYLSGHPTDQFKDYYKLDELDTLHLMEEKSDGQKLVLAIRIANVRPYTSKAGKAMAFLEVDDRFLRVEAVMFNRTWTKWSQQLKSDQLAIALCTLQKQDDTIKLLVDDLAIHNQDNISYVQQMLNRFVNQARRTNEQQQGQTTVPLIKTTAKKAEVEDVAKHSSRSKMVAEKLDVKDGQKLYLKISGEKEQSSIMERVHTLIHKHSGEIPVILYYESTGKIVALSEKYKVDPTPVLIEQLQFILGAGSVRAK